MKFTTLIPFRFMLPVIGIVHHFRTAQMLDQGNMIKQPHHRYLFSIGGAAVFWAIQLIWGGLFFILIGK